MYLKPGKMKPPDYRRSSHKNRKNPYKNFVEKIFYYLCIVFGNRDTNGCPVV